MKLTKKSVIDSINILEDGTMEIRRADKILEDGKEIGKTYHRHCLKPGSPLTNQDEKVSAIANVVWTEKVITDYKKKQKENVI